MWELALSCVLALTPSVGLVSTCNVDGFTIVKHYGECFEILQSDGSAAAIDVVIMGDGFTSDEQDEFDAAADNCVDELFEFPPYSDRKCAFTIWKVNLVSNDSGIDYYDSADNLTDRDTPLGCSFGKSDEPVAKITGDFDLCRRAADAAEIPAGCYICVIVNDDIGHDGAMSYPTEAVTFMSSLFPWGVVIAHELGHQLAGLGDEYPCRICDPAVLLYDPTNSDLNRTYSGSPPIVAPNLSTTYERALIPWSGEIAAETALPTVPLTPDNSEEVGAWEGGGTYAYGVYRPQRYCVMDVVMYQDEDRDHFCKICSDALESEFTFRCILPFSRLDAGIITNLDPRGIRFPIPPCSLCPDSLQNDVKLQIFAERFGPSFGPGLAVYDDWGKRVAVSSDPRDGRLEVSFRANRARSYRGALFFDSPEARDLVIRSEIYVNGVKVEMPDR